MPSTSADFIDPYVARKYRFHRKIGRGFFSIIWHAFKTDRKPVAVKRVFNAFQNRADAQRAYREVSLLSALNNPCIIALHDVHASSEDRDLYLVLDFMPSDLATAIKANVFRPIHKEFVMWQILCALKYLHSAGIVHRDLTPAAVLINTRAEVKLCDFNSARLVKGVMIDPLGPPVPTGGLKASTVSATGGDAMLTEYQSSRWYRAPEQILFSRNYGVSVDMWAAGCIFAEMLLFKPLFPGTSALSQLEMIVHFTGRPSEAELGGVDCGQYSQLLEGVGKRKGAEVSEIFRAASVEAMDLVTLMLRFVPEVRISAEEALEHPFVGHFHNPDEEVVYSGDLRLALDDNVKYSVNVYRDFVYAEFVGRDDIKERLDGDRERRKAELGVKSV
jgi:mitogen-activated protein kinase 15